jgi:hypothetical protein
MQGGPKQLADTRTLTMVAFSATGAVIRRKQCPKRGFDKYRLLESGELTSGLPAYFLGWVVPGFPLRMLDCRTCHEYDLLGSLSSQKGGGMKRERALQIVLVLAGLFYSFWGYILFDALWRSRWLKSNDDVLPMFVSLNFVLGIFLLLAVKHPARHRSLISYGAWSSLTHAFTMTIQSAEAWAHGMHRKDSPQDIVIIGVVGVALLVLLPARESAPAGPIPISQPHLA